MYKDKVRIDGVVYERLDGYQNHDIHSIPEIGSYSMSEHPKMPPTAFYKATEIWHFDCFEIFIRKENCAGCWNSEEDYKHDLYSMHNNPTIGKEGFKFVIMPEGSYEKFTHSRDVDMSEKPSFTEIKSVLGIMNVREEYPKLWEMAKNYNLAPADRYFKEALDDVLTNGINTKTLPCSDVRTKWADGTPAHYVYVTNKIYEYDLSEGYFPLISYRPQAWKSAIKEVLWIYQDQSNELKLLQDKHNIHWWNQHESKDLPGTIGQRYGATIKRYDLINKLLKDLSGKGSNRRLVVDMLQFTDINESDGLYPCAYSTTWNVRGEYLDMILNQRSSDFLMAWSINQAQYAALLIMIAKVVGLKPGKFTHVIGNLHVYDRHLEAAKILLERKVDSTSTPTIHFNPFDENDFYSFGIKDFVLEGYEPNPEQLKLEIAL